MESDQRYWAIESIFSGNIDGAPLNQIGAIFDYLNGKWFARSVFEGSPAFQSNIKQGDEIIAADGAPLSPVESFSKTTSGDCVLLKAKRVKTVPTTTVCVRPSNESIQRSMLRGSLNSLRVYKKNGKRIGYFHLWAGTHPEFQKLLANVANQMESISDALILDIRDGYGGADVEFLDPFFKPTPPVYSKPLFLLINQGVRSGKETLAYVLKTTRRATLIGTKTAGYYLGGRLFDIVPNKAALYLAVCGDSPAWVKLEGIGVSPDIEVESPLPYSGGDDPQLRVALSLAEGKK